MLPPSAGADAARKNKAGHGALKPRPVDSGLHKWMMFDKRIKGTVRPMSLIGGDALGGGSFSTVQTVVSA